MKFFARTRKAPFFSAFLAVFFGFSSLFGASFQKEDNVDTEGRGSTLANSSSSVSNSVEAANSKAASANGQFMCWSDGKNVTLRWVVSAPTFPSFRKSVPQGINPSQLLLDEIYNPVAKPPRVFVGEAQFPDYGYKSINIRPRGVTIPVMRTTSPSSEFQAMAYVHCGLLITQVKTPKACKTFLCKIGDNPLHLELRVRPQACFGLPMAEFAIRDNGEAEVLIGNPLVGVTLIQEVLR